jgi:hypothetical protein
MRTMIAVVVICCGLVGCAVPQYQKRLVPYEGTRPQMPAAQVVDICNAQARNAYSSASAQAQAQLDARNNQVTGYNCSTYGQANSFGYNTNYSGTTNCAAVTANPYGGKYGGFAALGDSLGVAAHAAEAQNNVLVACAAQYGYRIESYCVANCGGPQSAASPGPPKVATPQATYSPPSNAELCQRLVDWPSTGIAIRAERELSARGVKCPAATSKTVSSPSPPTEAELRMATNAELCYRAEYQRDADQKAVALKLLAERNATCR